jgi:hypothetical protein
MLVAYSGKKPLDRFFIGSNTFLKRSPAGFASLPFLWVSLSPSIPVKFVLFRVCANVIRGVFNSLFSVCQIPLPAIRG